MASLIAAISGDDTGSTQILIAHVNDTRSLLNGATAYLVKWIHNDANAFQIDPATSGYVATNAWFQLLDNADAETLSIRYNGQIRSSLATGTAPFVVASTTVVANLNADTVDGIDTPATPTGALVTTTNTQTLTNKTLTAPTIADFTNAAHDHGDADDGGAVLAAAVGLTTEGDILYRNATGNARLPKGTAGQVLTQNAALTAPEWSGAVNPTGAILAYGAATAPGGYLLCDGTAVSRTTYSALFAIIATAFGVGDGSTTFNVPDLRGRFPLGVDGAAGRITSDDTLGAASGSESHDHASATTGAESGLVSVATGGGQAAGAHTHALDLPALVALPPYQCVHYIIKT